MTLARRQPTALLLVLAVTLLLVACGDGGGGSGAGTTVGTAAGTTAPAAGPTSTVPSSTGSTTVDPALLDRVEKFTGLSHNHVQGHVDYPQTPPVGGDHNPLWQNCGFYSRPVMTEMAVHSLEHGAVWITFRPGISPADLDAIRQQARRPYVLASPWADDNLPAPVVASAWGLQLKLDSATDPALAAFVQAYANGPQSPERGAPCSGGVGAPER